MLTCVCLKFTDSIRRRGDHQACELFVFCGRREMLSRDAAEMCAILKSGGERTTLVSVRDRQRALQWAACCRQQQRLIVGGACASAKFDRRMRRRHGHERRGREIASAWLAAAAVPAVRSERATQKAHRRTRAERGVLGPRLAPFLRPARQRGASLPGGPRRCSASSRQT
jgi:hypothetical protein